MKVTNFIMPGIGFGYFILAILSIKQPTIISNKFMYFISVSALMFTLAEIVRTIVIAMDRVINIIYENKKVRTITLEKYIKFINLNKQCHNISYGIFSIIGIILLVIWPVVKLKDGNYTESANTITIFSFSLFFLQSTIETLIDKVIKSFQESLTKSMKTKKKLEKELEKELKKAFEKEVEEEKLKEKVQETVNEVGEALKNELSYEKVKEIIDKKVKELEKEKNVHFQ